MLEVFSVNSGKIKCLETEVGLPTSLNDKKPHISIVFETVKFFKISKSVFLEYGWNIRSLIK